jgi:hypothetical protein
LDDQDPPESVITIDRNSQSMSLGIDFPGYVRILVERERLPIELATSRALHAAARTSFGEGTLIVAAAGNESRRDLYPEFEIAASLPAASQGRDLGRRPGTGG